MKHFLLGVLFTLLVVFLGGFAYLRLGYVEVRGDLPPSNWERALMFSAAHASVRRRAPELPNPAPATDENLIAGGKIYSDECAGCHGAVGKPDQTGDSCIHRFRSFRWRAPPTRRHKFSGLLSTASGCPACSPTANGIPTRNYGLLPRTLNA